MIRSGRIPRVARHDAPAGTKDRILDAAERLFAERGVGATSLRSVIAEAGVNLAAVHYHFGSKDELLRAVFRRHMDRLNAVRIGRLNALEQTYRGQPIPVDQLVHAFIEPVIRMAENPEHGPNFMRLLGRILAEPENVGKLAPGQLQSAAQRFADAARTSLPELPLEELLWRVMFGIGAVAHVMRVGDLMPKLSGGICKRATADETVRRLVEFLAAGLNAPHKEEKR